MLLFVSLVEMREEVSVDERSRVSEEHEKLFTLRISLNPTKLSDYASCSI